MGTDIEEGGVSEETSEELEGGSEGGESSDGRIGSEELAELQSAIAEDGGEAEEEGAARKPVDTPESRAKAREERALAAERARLKKREVARLDEAQAIIEKVKSYEQRREQELSQREANLKRMEREAAEAREQLLNAVRSGGLDALSALGLDLASLQAAEIEKHDPVVQSRTKAEKALAELEALKAEMKAEREAQLKAREAEEQQARMRHVQEARQHEQHALISFASSGDAGVPASVAAMATAATRNPLARRALIEAADTLAETYHEMYGELPTIRDLVAGLDGMLDFVQAPSVGSAPAQGAQRGQARTGRTMASPAMQVRESAPRELSEEERLNAELRELEEALQRDLAAG